MATQIILKKSSTIGAVPLSTDLEIGEVALNLADRKLYTKNNSDNVIQVGNPYVGSTAPTSPAEGDLWYNTGTNSLQAYDGTAWQSAGYQTFAELEDVNLTSLTAGDHVKWDGSNFVNSNFESDVEGLLTAANTGTGYGDLSYADGVYTFDRVTAADIRSEVSAVDAGGDGSFSYNSTNGVFTYTGPSAAEVRAHLADGVGVTYNEATGTFSVDFTEFDTDDITEGTTNQYYLDSRARAAVSVTDTGGDGSLAYNSTSGVITYTGPSAAEAQAHFSAGTNTTYSSGTFDITDATIRGKVSVTDAGGDGSLAYNSTTGVITYTGPSATEVRAHFTGGTGVTITNGEVAIGQSVGTSDDVTFNKVTTDLIEGGSTITIDPAGTGDATGEVIIAGSLTVQGTTTSVNSNEVNIGDSIILLNSDETGTPSQNGGIEIERGTSANKSFVWNEADDAWDLSNETLQNVTLDGGTY